MRQWIGSAVVVIITCRLFSTKPLSLCSDSSLFKPMMTYHEYHAPTQCQITIMSKNDIIICMLTASWINDDESETLRCPYFMMTSSNENVFRITGHFAGNSLATVNFPHKGKWRGALTFSLFWAWMNGWLNNRETGDLRRHRAHYDVTVMCSYHFSST